MTMIKSELMLSCQTLLPIVFADENFEYFVQEKNRQHFFSSLISASDFSRVMSLMQQLALKKQPISYIFHLRQKNKPSMLVLVNGSYQNGTLAVTLYDIASMDEPTLRSLTYQKLRQLDEKLLKEHLHA